MRANGLLALALAASSVLGAVLPEHGPASTQALDARAEEYRAELEARGLHSACVRNSTVHPPRSTTLSANITRSFRWPPVLPDMVY
jgi:hypothetical protein